MVGSERSQRLEDEAPLEHQRVRHLEARLRDPLVAPQQQVEVDRPRPPARPDPLPAEAPLDVEQMRQERPRRQRGLDLCGRVQERRLVAEAPRLGLEERRQARRPDQLRGAP